MGLISNGTTIFDAGAIDSGIAKGALTFIKKLTASSSATLSFVDGASSVVLDNTYKEYLFTFKNIHPQNNATRLKFNVSIDAGSNYNVAKTSTMFNAYHNEGDTGAALAYETGTDSAQATGTEHLGNDTTNANDSCMGGYLHLFNPASTTFVKHFISRAATLANGEYAVDTYKAGYCNTTSAIDAIQFSMSSGNIDAGDICLYGIS
jgi:predicted NAD/FAD-binding protein